MQNDDLSEAGLGAECQTDGSEPSRVAKRGQVKTRIAALSILGKLNCFSTSPAAMMLPAAVMLLKQMSQDVAGMSHARCCWENSEMDSRGTDPVRNIIQVTLNSKARSLALCPGHPEGG